MISIIVEVCKGIKQLFEPNKKAPTVNVTITINGGDNNKVDVYCKKQ